MRARTKDHSPGPVVFPIPNPPSPPPPLLVCVTSSSVTRFQRTGEPDGGLDGVCISLVFKLGLLLLPAA